MGQEGREDYHLSTPTTHDASAFLGVPPAAVEALDDQVRIEPVGRAATTVGSAIADEIARRATYRMVSGSAEE